MSPPRRAFPLALALATVAVLGGGAGGRVHAQVRLVVAADTVTAVTIG